MTKIFEELSAALPSSFNFYHLGQVELHPNIQDPWAESMEGICFHLQGDLNATLVILVERHLDRSTYSELGNILASKIANQLYQERQLQITITPPQILSDNQLSYILDSRTSSTRKTYAHRFDDKIIYIETLFVPRTMEGIGNA